MAVIIQLRRDTGANWSSANPVLAQGEAGLNLDNGLVKIGDGTTSWLSLDYYGTTASGVIDHGLLTGLLDDDHTQYILVDGSRGFTSTVSGVLPTQSYHIATKEYVDSHITEITHYERFSAGDLELGSNNVPAIGTAGPVTGRLFDDTTNEYLYGHFTIKQDIKANTNITVKINWMPNDTQTGGPVSKVCRWVLTYHVYEDGETYSSKTSSSVVVLDGLPADAQAGTFQSTTIGTLNYNDSNNPFSAGQKVSFSIMRNASSAFDTVVGDAALLLLTFEYITEN